MSTVRARGQTLWVMAAVAFAVAMAPAPASLREASPWVAIPLDPALRVPFSAALLSHVDGQIQPGERVLEVSFEGGAHPRSPRDRDAFYRAVEVHPEATMLALVLARESETRRLEVPVVRESGWRRIARNWPLVFVATGFLLFGFSVGIGSRHPSATPLFALSTCAGLGILAQLDLLLPLDRGLFGLGLLRPRLGLLAVALTPATILHLAMRFPVVVPRFRNASVAAVPYAFWLLVAGFGQLQQQDASFVNSLEQLAIGSSFVSACVLVAASLVAARTMSPIERSRTRALVVGLGLGCSAPFVLFVSGAPAPSRFQAPLIISLLAFPAAISWAIARYRLLDPPAWLRGIVARSLTAAVSLLLAGAAVSFTVDALVAEDSRFGPGEAVAIALAAGVLYQLLDVGVTRLARARLGSDRDQLLEAAIRAFAGARDPRVVEKQLEAMVYDRLAPQAVELVPLDPPAPTGALGRSGLELWSAEGRPRHAPVFARARSEDPAPGVAEAAVPLHPETCRAKLLALAARPDGLPYTEAQRQMLESLLLVATIALDAANAASGLERLVAQRTASLQGALSDRKRVLRAARAIFEAQERAGVEHAIEDFLAGDGAGASWEVAPPPADSTLALAVPASPETPRFLVVDGLEPERVRELEPQLQTLCAFAALASARLSLLGELKHEVERQSGELAEIRSRRLYAEFVRGVAHELRKPAEEVRRRADEVWEAGGAPRDALRRIRAAIREMSRRLDLLLFHSGVRLARQRIDLVRVVEDAVENARATCPERIYTTRHDFPRLPLVGDPSRLQSVVENLLDNAAKALSVGDEIRIRTRCERSGAAPRAIAILEVEDSGPGIEDDQLQAIFEPGVSFTADGFGLGLSLCSEIVRGHRGRIEVESAPGRTVFRVVLPQLFGEAGDEDDEHHSDPSG